MPFEIFSDEFRAAEITSDPSEQQKLVEQWKLERETKAREEQRAREEAAATHKSLAEKVQDEVLSVLAQIQIGDVVRYYVTERIGEEPTYRVTGRVESFSESLDGGVPHAIRVDFEGGREIYHSNEGWRPKGISYTTRVCKVEILDSSVSGNSSI